MTGDHASLRDEPDRRMEEESYWRAAAEERPGPLRRRRQMKWVREFEGKYGRSELLRRLVGD